MNTGRRAHEHGSQLGGYGGYFGHKRDVNIAVLRQIRPFDVTTQAVWRQAMFFFFFFHIAVYSHHRVAFVCETPG